MMSRNLNNLFLQMCHIGVCSCGMVLIMVAGQIDLAAGSVMLQELGAERCGVTKKTYNMNPVLAIVITLLDLEQLSVCGRDFGLLKGRSSSSLL